MANKFVTFLKNYLLGISIIVSVVLSIVLGIILRQVNSSYSPRVVMYVGFLGDLFLRMIRALILPLIISSLIAAIAPLDTSLSKQIGRRAIVYILSTTVLAVCLGLLLVMTIKPGSDGSSEKIETDRNTFTIVDTLLDLIR
jgi:Na+/H+-dicarboxylate symporter